jgi:hypothetical protein
MGDFYKMVETPLDKAVDKAIAEANEDFLANPEAVQAAEEAGERWAALFAAQEAAGSHGIVLPKATAQAILDALEGREHAFTTFDDQMPAKMLAEAMRRAGE